MPEKGHAIQGPIGPIAPAQVCQSDLIEHHHAHFAGEFLKIVDAEIPRLAHLGETPDEGRGALVAGRITITASVM
jgi:hypothetical protein